MSESSQTRPTARVLVVDDQSVQRAKLGAAVTALGHEVLTAGGGAQALTMMREQTFDLVLLDLLMPDVDGFDVMQFMQRDKRMRGTPVIVVSALESDMSAVVRAVEMGAEDVLPKSFDRVLLSARLASVLERRRHRWRERDERQQLERLTDAAMLLEHQPLRASALGLQATCERTDPIGALARVFVQLSEAVQARDARVQLQIDRVRTLGLAVAVALTLGLIVPLARFARLEGGSAGAVFAGATSLVALFALTRLLWRGGTTRPLSGLARDAAWLAVSAGGVGLFPLIWLAGHAPAATLAVLLPAELLGVLLLGALLKRRLPTARHGAALLVGLLALAAIGSPVGATALGLSPAMIALALLSTVGCAVAVHAWPRTAGQAASGSADAHAVIGLAAAMVSALALPFVAGELAALLDTPASVLLLVLLGASLSAGVSLRSDLIDQAGATLTAAATIGLSLATIAWSALLLHERLPLFALLPLAGFAACALLVVSGQVARSGSLTLPPDAQLD